MLSTAGNTYDADYFGDTSKLSEPMRRERGYEPGKNWDEPMFNVFRKDGDKIPEPSRFELVEVAPLLPDSPQATRARYLFTRRAEGSLVEVDGLRRFLHREHRRQSRPHRRSGYPRRGRALR